MHDPKRSGFYLGDGSVNVCAVFGYAVGQTMIAEGGGSISRDPADPGGLCRYGISQQAFPDVDIKNLTREAARNLYWVHYWKLPKVSKVAAISPAIGIKLFDLCVNCGQKTAIMMLQRAANVVCTGRIPAMRAAKWRQVVARVVRGRALVVDGIIGPMTLSVIEACPYKNALLMGLKGEAYDHYKKGAALYRAGWLERLWE